MDARDDRWAFAAARAEAAVDALRGRDRPLLLVGGTDDSLWDSATARTLTQDVLELPDADHGLAHTRDAAAVGGAVAAFSARLLRA